MKIFVYKTLVSVTAIFILYHATIGYQIRSIEIKFLNYFDKDKIIFLRQKIKSEILAGIEKDRILSIEDAIIIKKFINKISRELQDTN